MIHKAHQMLFLIASRGAGQILVFASTIFVARYATPAVYGDVGLFTSMCSLFAMASGLRLEVRGLIAKRDATRRAFIGMSYASNMVLLAFGLLLLGISYFLSVSIPIWLWFLPAGILLSSLIQYVLPAQNSSVEQLNRLGVLAQIASISTAIFQVASALLAPTTLTLILSRLGAWLLAISYMHNEVRNGVLSAFSIKWRNAKRILISSKREISYGIPASVASVLTFQVPVYIFSLYSMGEKAGIYWFSFNLLLVPYFVVYGSLRPVFLRAIGKDRSNDSLYTFLKSSIYKGAALGLIYSLLSTAGCWVVVKCLLGSEWQPAIRYTFFLGILVIALVAHAPISLSISALGLQRLDLVNNLIQALLRAAAMAFVFWAGGSDDVAIFAMSVVSAAGYLVYLVGCLGYIKRRGRACKKM